MSYPRLVLQVQLRCLEALFYLALDVGWCSDVRLRRFTLGWPLRVVLWGLAEWARFRCRVCVGDVLGSAKEGDSSTCNLGLAEGSQRSQQCSVMRVDLWGLGRCLDCC